MKKFEDFSDYEITDPWSIGILQRLAPLRKRNRGRPDYSPEDVKELNAIVKEIRKKSENDETIFAREGTVHRR
jgi:hypothetical protein